MGTKFDSKLCGIKPGYITDVYTPCSWKNQKQTIKNSISQCQLIAEQPEKLKL
jgi:hypothetical protein